MKYFRVFETESNYTDFVNGSNYVTPNLCVIRSTGGTKCNPHTPPPLSGGGSKVVNKGSIILTDPGSFMPYSCVFTYPVASGMEVMCGDILFSFNEGEIDSLCLNVGPMEELGESVEIFPSNEDDTYIYEITINV